MRLLAGAGAYQPPAADGGADSGAADGDAGRGTYLEHLSVPDLSVGTYSIPAGGRDTQSPHTEDEIYVVTAGRARLVTPTGGVAVGPGSVAYVPAGEEHRFVDVTEDFATLVVFGPAEYSRG